MESRIGTTDEKRSLEVQQATSDITAEVQVASTWRTRLEYLKYYFTSKEGWLGDYNYLYLITPNIWPLNRKYRDYEAPFFGVNDEVPIFLTIILGLQHALCMVGSIASVPLAIAGGAFYLDTELTEYLVSASFIVTGIATAIQVTRVHLKGTPYYIGTGLLSVVGPTFDVLAITSTYSSLKYGNGTCPTAEDGTKMPCPEAWGAVLGSILCTVWVQVLMSMVPPKTLNRLFPKMVTGSLLLLVGVYLIGNGLQNWGGSSNCHHGAGYYALCPNSDAPKPLPW